MKVSIDWAQVTSIHNRNFADVAEINRMRQFEDTRIRSNMDVPEPVHDANEIRSPASKLDAIQPLRWPGDAIDSTDQPGGANGWPKVHGAACCSVRRRSMVTRHREQVR
jgi:hypothetical protein